MIERILQALRAMKDADGHIHLDREQALYLDFFFCILLEHEGEFKDSVSLKYATLDLLGALGEERKEGA